MSGKSESTLDVFEVVEAQDEMRVTLEARVKRAAAFPKSGYVKLTKEWIAFS